MQLGKSPSSIALLCALALTGCAHARGDGTDAESFRAERNRAVEALIAQATPSNLAAAALLAPPGDLSAREPLGLIERAEALAPQRTELVWLHLAICERLKCDAKAQIEARLQALDPDNGFVWTSDLERAKSSGSDAAVTAAIAQIGARPRMTFYWNQLEVMMVDALAVSNPSQSLATRGTAAIGMLAAQAIPALQPMSKACRLEQLDLSGRRAACAAMVARLEQSSTVLTQSLALSLQERWWPAGSPQRDIVRAKRRRLDYLMTTSSRIRWWRMNRDMAVRINAARWSDREEDVELAMVKSFGLPLEPALDWKDTLHSD
ncbi:MAG: hypothetical protein JWM63_836 [Gammaproteobacteria bacterium]|nr:hypothetical protein [Gammaproteobacteria bacterium]